MPTRDPLEAAIRNQFDLRRLENGLSAEARRRLRRTFDRLVGELAKSDVTSTLSAVERRLRIERLTRTMRSIIEEDMDGWVAVLRRNLAELGTQQAGWARTALIESLGGNTALRALGIRLDDPTGLGVNFFKSIVDTNPFQGQVLAEWAESQTMRTLVDVRKEIQTGLFQNETIDQLVRRVRGKSDGKGGFTGGVLEKTTRETQGIVRTAVTDIATTAHFEAYRAQSDVTTTYTFVATLDGRTTILCFSLDGQSFAYDDEDAPRPPMHWKCRSSIVPDIMWDVLGLPEPEGMFRIAGGGEKVPAGTVAETWLRAKSPEEQDRILGPERGKLFRAGITLREMVDADYETLTIAEIRERAA